jgi:hypothetical protein
VASEALVQDVERLGTIAGSKMLNVLSYVAVWLVPPLVASYALAESSLVMLSLSIPSISTNKDALLWLVQGGPGETQPGGVEPDVSQRFAAPLETVVVVPGLNGLAE